MSGGTAWTPEEDAELRRLLALGWSARRIGEEIGRSRNGIIGRANRLGLAKATKSSVRRLWNIKKRQLREQRSAERKKHQLSSSRPVSILKLPRVGRCRWPLWPDKGPAPGGADALFCGARCGIDDTYCSEHAWRAAKRGEAA